MSQDLRKDCIAANHAYVLLDTAGLNQKICRRGDRKGQKWQKRSGWRSVPE
ncbi:MAG: hypothetical protein KME16_14130 [Scytolyngbya sp. HA4215-MV1]|nr:hypothetical protein [Scytolyngbya sp. HA4215-MV1]